MGYKYRDFIEARFLIDEPRLGQLVPFKFRPVQNAYYDELVRQYDIEKNGISTAVREIILKARREGFSSFILALFAADDILQENPTESLVISYKDEATDTFRKRYRLYITSYFAKKSGYTTEQIQKEVGILDKMAKEHLSIDANDIELKHNKAHFYCGTASARVGGRGGVLQKLLFSEAAYYPDTEKMTAREIVDGTLRQIDISSGWVFIESTANMFNYFEEMWSAGKKGLLRFVSRFYGWKDFYTQAEFDIIATEFIDKSMLKQEYPATPEEAFIASGTGYFDNEKILAYIQKAPQPILVGDVLLVCKHRDRCKALSSCDNKVPEFTEASNGALKIWEKPSQYASYVLGGDVSEGVDGDYSVADVTDNRTLKTVATFYDNKCPPDKYAQVVYALGIWYNSAYVGVEANKDGLWVNDELMKMGYPNLYYREQLDDITKSVTHKIGFKTDEKTRPYILSELRKLISLYDGVWTNAEFLRECLVFVRNKVGRAEAMSGKHDDLIFAKAIALEIRRNAPQAFQEPTVIPQTGQQYVMARLEAIKAKRNSKSNISQNFYI
jgi:hypothetical protein